MKKYILHTAIVILTLCGMTSLTACSRDDEQTNAGPGPLAEKLAGTWYSIYEASGTAEIEGSDGASVPYSFVIDVYHFEENGKGNFQRCFFFDDDTRPALVQGILGYGDFTYSTTADGRVNIVLVNNWNQEYQHAWNVSYADETVTAKSVDGQQLNLEKADEETQAALNNMAERNGNTTKYDVNDYKPVNVDNSQWMKSLADSRLVADLSLPGSHDACTAEGWYDKWLLPLAEGTAKTQELTIREQLKIGVRVFDLRPERVYDHSTYVLRCSHGIMDTKLLVKDFFLQLKDFLAVNPTEFCIITVDLSASSDRKSWARDFNELINNAEIRSMFIDFKPRLTVGEMRGHVLILSKHEYAAKPIGGYCYGWGDDLELEKQTKGHITGPDGTETPLWVQDYWGKSNRKGKDEAVVRMLEAAVGRDMTTEKPAWVINYPSAYFGMPLSDHYRENAVEANKVTVDWLSDHTGSVGIIYMDFVGMDKTPSYSCDELYETCGMKLLDSVIKQNQK